MTPVTRSTSYANDARPPRHNPLVENNEEPVDAERGADDDEDDDLSGESDAEGSDTG